MRVCNGKHMVNAMGGAAAFDDRVNDCAILFSGHSRQVRQKMWAADYVNYIYRDKSRYILAKKNVSGFRR